MSSKLEMAIQHLAWLFKTTQISKSERIPLAGSYGLLLLNCGLLSLIRDYNYKEKEPNFKFSYQCGC